MPNNFFNIWNFNTYRELIIRNKLSGKAVKAYQREQLKPECILHIIPKITEQLNPEHKHQNINVIVFCNLIKTKF